MKLSWRILDRLAKQYGPSFYLFDAAAFDRNYTELLAAFRRHYPRTSLAYSYKTNYLPLLCRRAHDLGGYAEVVSDMEYELARRIGVPPSEIIFNGPYKDGDAVIRALCDGALVNLDSAAELPLVRAAARQSAGRVLRVGLRCNFDFDASGVSRFGIDAAGDALAATIAKLRRIKQCRIDGLHCHFMPPGRSPAAYAAITAGMLRLSRELFGAQPPALLDIGGGFCGPMPPELASQFDFKIPAFHEYAQAIAGQFAQSFPGENVPELILEPGIAVAADVLKFVAKVISFKAIRGKNYALLAGSVYDVKPTKNVKNLPLDRFTCPGKGRQHSGPLDLVGYTCMEDDCLYRNYAGPLAVNDYIVFHNVGAYTIVLKPPFIAPAAPILAVSAAGKGKFEVVRRRETFDDVFATYAFDTAPAL